jgi:hypothetical protein
MSVKRTAQVKGLPNYQFERFTEIDWTTNQDRVTHGWTNTVTEDWATKFPTKAAAVLNARRFENGLREGRFI